MDNSSGSFASVSAEVKDASPQKDALPDNEGDPEKLEEARQKEKDIAQSCKKGDIRALIELATSPDGLVADELRKEACKRSSLPRIHCALTSSF
jgi:hypothetical protein